MKVFFVYLKAFGQVGGIETFNKYFIKALNSDKNINSVIVSFYDLHLEIPKDIDVITFEGNLLKLIKYLFKTIKKDSLVFFGHINLLPVAILIRLLKGNNKLHTIIHGIDAWIKFPIYKRVFFNFIKFLSVSNYTKNLFCELNGVDKKNVDIFPNCIELNKHDVQANPYNKSNFNILTVSRLSSNDNYKGVDTLIKMLPHIIDTIPNIKLTIIGKGNDQKRLQNLSIKLKVSNYIDFLGYVETTAPFYKFCDVFALPSKSEGFGIVYLEAMQYKVPVIAANSGGSVDVVKEKITGRLVNYNDELSLAYVICEIFKGREEHNIIGISGYKYLIANFTFERFTARLLKIIDNSRVNCNV